MFRGSPGVALPTVLPRSSSPFCSPSCVWAFNFKPYCTLRVDGFAHFLSGGVARVQRRTSPTLSGIEKSLTVSIGIRHSTGRPIKA